MKIPFGLIYFLIFNPKSLTNVFSSPINDDNQCITQAGGPGRCVTSRNCEAVMTNKIKVEMCSKCKTLGLICCPPITKTGESSNIAPAIINGTPVEPNKYPFMVALGKNKYGTIYWKCGGSIITRRLILTAAHCHGITNIALGTNNLNGLKPNQTINHADFDFVSHADYKRTGKHGPNDIAIIKLKADLEFNISVNSIALVSKNDAETMSSDVAKLIGFGSTICFGRFSSNILLQAELHKTTCEYMETTNQICYIGHGNNTAPAPAAGRGDSGGPLFVTNNSDGQYVQIGIASYGVCQGSTVFTSVAVFSDWINSHIHDTTTIT